MFTIKSRAFQQSERIPRKYAGEGENVSPPIEWSEAPQGTREFALICDDPDAPTPQPWVHWVVYGIPSEAHELPEGRAPQATQGLNAKGAEGYTGPMPPPGHGEHHYHFRLYALDRPLMPTRDMDKSRLLEAMRGHVLAESELVGTYER